MSAPTLTAPPAADRAAGAPPAESRRERRKRERIEELDATIPVELYGLKRGTVSVLTACCVLFAVFTLVPVAWIIFNSTKTQPNIFGTFGFWFARPFVFFHNFRMLFENVDGDGTYIQWFGNTALYAVLGGGGATALAAFAGYGFARFQFRGSKAYFYIIIGALLVPVGAITLPLYLVYAKAHLINSIWGMILPSLVSPVGVYLMRTYIQLSVPRELVDAARIDGAGEARIFFRIALPLMVPGLMTVLLLSVVGVWNNYFLPLIIFSNNDKFPLTVGMGLWSQHATTSGDQNLYPLIVMGGLVTIAPLIILFLILQRYWRSGMLLGSIANLSKGPVVPAISLSKLTKVYATGVKALDALDLDVGDGEFVVLVGPSGCGKTTALRMVAGLERITSGTVSLGGQVVNDISPRRRDIAMVFQNYALYPHLSVYQNIGFALENKKVDRAERDRRIRAAAETLGLGDLLGRKPRQLSGGQRQRVAMGRALVREPSVFLMDEPLSNLDAKLRVQMRSEVLRVHRSLGAATLYVTHDQTEAMTMGDRVAVLLGGVLQQYDTPRSLYERPANVFAATFIGSPPMNLYEGDLSADGAAGRSGTRPTVVLGSQRLDLPAQVAARVVAYQGRKVIVGVRPEDLVLPAGTRSAVGGTGGTGTVATGLVGDVRLVEVLGSEQHVYFSIDATQAAQAAGAAAAGESAEAGILAASAPNGVARLGTGTGIRAGDRVTFAVDPARLYFFDPDTGHAIAS